MKYTIAQRNTNVKNVYYSKRDQIYKFKDINLLLNKYTLVPHPDTFQLIMNAIKIINKNNWINTIADPGTGSGVIAISLAKKFPNKTFFASDICPHALKIAKKNSKLNSIKNICFLLNKNGIWLNEYKGKQIDFIISNPPFVGEEEYRNKSFFSVYPEVSMEPISAILTPGDKLGLSPYLRIIENSKKNKTKMFLFHCNSDNLSLLTQEIHKLMKCKMYTIKDKNKNDRFLLIKVISFL